MCGGTEPSELLEPSEKQESYITIVVAKKLFINTEVIFVIFTFWPEIVKGVLLAVSPRVWGDNLTATLCIIRNM